MNDIKTLYFVWFICQIAVLFILIGITIDRRDKLSLLSAFGFLTLAPFSPVIIFMIIIRILA